MSCVQQTQLVKAVNTISGCDFEVPTWASEKGRSWKNACLCLREGTFGFIINTTGRTSVAWHCHLAFSSLFPFWRDKWWVFTCVIYYYIKRYNETHVFNVVICDCIVQGWRIILSSPAPVAIQMTIPYYCISCACPLMFWRSSIATK